MHRRQNINFFLPKTLCYIKQNLSFYRQIIFNSEHVKSVVSGLGSLKSFIKFHEPAVDSSHCSL